MTGEEGGAREPGIFETVASYKGVFPVVPILVGSYTSKLGVVYTAARGCAFRSIPRNHYAYVTQLVTRILTTTSILVRDHDEFLVVSDH